jgi:putative ABC transport system permease protein
VLDALGIPRGRLVALVLTKSFWIGAFGLLLAIPIILAVQHAAATWRTTVELPKWLWAVTVVLTMVIATGSGVLSLRELRKVEPAELLRG